MKTCFLLLAFIVFGFAVVWTTTTPVPQALAGAGCAVFNDTVYFIGGRDSAGNRYATNYVFDPITGNWSSKTSMTYARAHIGCVLVGGKIYSIGGWVGSTASNIVEEYDPLADTWTTKAPMPTPRYAYGMAVVNDKIYVIGGMNMSGQVFNTVEEYDPAGDSWTTKASMPTPRFGPGCAAYSDSIFVYGGSTVIGGGLTTAHQRYDPVADSWTSRTNLPTARYCLGGFTLQNKLWALGGYTYTNYLTTLEMYVPTTDAWYTEGSMQYPRQSIAVGKFDEYYVYVIGGWNNGALNYNEEGWFEVGVAEQKTTAITVTVGPNPFKDITTIALQVMGSEYPIACTIYDALGRQVRTFSQLTTPGPTTAVISWDGRDNSGHTLPNGAYLLVVDVNGVKQTTKLVLLK